MSKTEKLELKHHKDFHGIQFQDFNVKERNLVFALCYKLMNQESNLLEFDVKEIARISNYTPTKAGDNIYKSLEETYKRIKNASIVVKKENGVKHFVLFTVFETFEDKGLVKIRVNDEYRYLLNQVAKPFTIQDVLEYTSLGSGYSQLMYSFLKEWEKSKNIEFKIDKFRELLGIPKGYRISEIDKFVLAPIFRELPEFFPNLKLEKIKTGRSVTSLKFTWSGKVEKIASQKKYDVIDIVEISDKLNKSIEKVKKNRFIAPLLTIDNIEILVEMFQEKDLIKGLNWSYREIKQEIKSLNYLIKSIKTGMEQKEKKLVVKTVPEVVQEQEIKEEILKENNLDLEKDQELKITEIEKITKDEYEELYKKFLQEQNTEHNLLTRKGFDIANKNKYEIIENKKQKIQEELVSSIYKIFMVENKLEESLESKKLFDEYLEKNYILTNDFESKEEWNNFLEFQDEVLNKEGYLTTKELNQDLTYDEYKEHLESETEDDYNSLGEVLLSNESLKENFQEQKTPLNDETLLEEIKIREQFSELFKNREDYNLAWLKNQIELEELKQILNKKKNKTEVKKLENIEIEKLLSKKGTPLKGGALVARLEKIARDENIKIQYKDKIIGE